MNDPRNEYEQLKKRNRRRLVGAVIMVAAACALLLSVLNRSAQNTNEPQQSVVINGMNESASGAATASAVVASAEWLAETSSAPINADTKQNNENTVNTAVAVPQNVIVPAMPPAAVEKPKPTEEKSKPTEEKPKKTTEKTTLPRQEKTDASVKPKTGSKLTPQEILNNKAAGTVSTNKTSTAQAAAPKAAAAQAKTSAAGAAPIQNGGKTVIQIGAYTSETQARTVQQKLAAAGFGANIVTSQTSKGVLYRVRSGGYADRAQAEQGLNKIRSAGLDGFIIDNKP
ncbi:SPOR domain-containing protein [Stenoxybacter acetivorans]|uniref:SPOR domain-containing protein n=1 Tax=Stenoxybacter acetivorans TaxID=422441 RepID=UPI000568D950|nr:SPOR domain-containing protein [Stenoxybacter acetivorans]